ncbi:divisome protein SepX/GlpR [Saccharothrix deserti]|uniref:divisome protein SepX/GlpR n=1 Tax=Saccharothrix deserti TaxID=2593674 RepID=UPI00131AF133|nr:gephyrin-like molybdotransferase receptor GlpR [Saccharothrix deserti]
MPSSLIVVGLVVAWLVVLVPLVARKRADTSRGSMEEEYDAMPEVDAEFEEYDDYDEPDVDDVFVRPRPFRPGRGGYDPETAAIVAQAKYAFRRRVVGMLLLAALVTGVVAGVLYPLAWWGHAAVDVTLVSYLGYLRRQVRIEEDIRARRLSRLGQTRRRPVRQAGEAQPHAVVAPPSVSSHEGETARDQGGLAPQPRFQHHVRPGTVVVDADDEDPVFVELDGPEALPYRRAVGE